MQQDPTLRTIKRTRAMRQGQNLDTRSNRNALLNLEHSIWKRHQTEARMVTANMRGEEHTSSFSSYIDRTQIFLHAIPPCYPGHRKSNLATFLTTGIFLICIHLLAHQYSGILCGSLGVIPISRFCFIDFCIHPDHGPIPPL